MQLARMPYGAFCDRELLGEGDHRRLGRLVGDERIVFSQAATDEMLTIAPARCRRMIGSACLQAMIVPRRLIAADAVERLLGDLGERLVAAGDADADIVVQDVDAAPALDRRRPSPRRASPPG